LKTRLDPRHIKREEIVQGLFSWSFRTDKTPKGESLKDVVANKEKIDSFIAKAAPEWPINQINRIDLAILRLAVYELFIVSKEPPKVIIDEAVELAKTYGSEKSPAFINGVLGTILKQDEGLTQRDDTRKP